MCEHLKLGVQDCLPCTVGQLVHGMFMTSYSSYLCMQTVMLGFCARTIGKVQIERQEYIRMC